jgi:hypothetical protein
MPAIRGGLPTFSPRDHSILVLAFHIVFEGESIS